MKRIAIIFILLCVALCGRAQTDTLLDANQSHQSGFRIDLGISAGATYFFGADNPSPYYSKYGFLLQIPLMARWNFAPHWQFSTGLRYDFNWNPLYYNIELSGTWDDGDNRGLQFIHTPTTVTQKAYSYISYVGIPVELKWYPWAQYKKILSLALDLFAGYAVTRYFNIDNKYTPGNWDDASARHDITHSSAIQPWKVEVGFTLATDAIGLTHGVRLFTNLLPTYQDPTTGEKVFTSGITLFL